VTHPDGICLTVASARGAPLQLGDTNRPTAVESLSQDGGGDGSSNGSGARAHSLNGSSGGEAAVGSSSNGNGSSVNGKSGPWQLRARLMLDCMGHYSPVVKQMRGRSKPEGMCLVVGSCADGFAPESNTTADLLYR
jgi:hypothetical protein